MAKLEEMANELGSRSLFLTILEAGSMIMLNVISLSGNALVCISVYRNPRLRTSTNPYIIALAISDLLSAIFVTPLVAGVLISGRWPFGGTVCQIHAFFSLFVIYISLVTMGLTAANRYVRMCKSVQAILLATKVMRCTRLRLDVCCLLYFDFPFHWLTGISLRTWLCGVLEQTPQQI